MLESLMSKRSLVALGAACLLSGCPDPQARYDDYLEASAEERGKSNEPSDYFGEPIATDNVAKVEVAGTFMLALLTELDGANPLTFRADVVVSDASDPWTINLELRPLRAMCGEGDDRARCTPDDPTYREVFEDAVITPDAAVPYVDVDNVGSFEMTFTGVEVPGDGNAVSGSDIVADLVLYGETRGDTICGKVSGAVTSLGGYPLMRDQNNFGAVRAAEDADFAALTALTRCP